MRSHGGKGGKRKAETNFVEAYSGASELAPPPTSRDVFAVPAKLRKMIQLKALVAGGARNGPQENPGGAKTSGRTSSKVAKKYLAGRNPTDSGAIGTQLATGENGLGQNAAMADDPARKRKGSFASKWKKGEEELKRLVEKMDKRVKTGISAGVGERRKSYLNGKKKKGKGRKLEADSLPALNQYDKVEFGDIVQAPPKLSFPKKAAEVKVKEKLRGEQAILQDRLRLEAIEAYRNCKEWSSRPGGQQLPILNVIDAEI